MMVEIEFIVATPDFAVGDTKSVAKITAIELLRGGYIKDPFDKPKRGRKPAAERETKEG